MGSIRVINKKDGTKNFHAEVRIKGYQHQRKTCRTKTEAKKWIQDTESAMRDGRYSCDHEARKKTLGDLIDRFIKNYLPKNPKGQQKQTALLTWWKEELGHLLLCKVTPSKLAVARDKLLGGITRRGMQRSPATVNRYLAALSKAFAVAVNEWEWLQDNPMRKISKHKEGRGRERYLTLDEKERLLCACKESRNPFLYPIVALALIIGMRKGEILGLRWYDINFEHQRITLRETKNGERRVLPLSDDAERLFKACPTFGRPSEELVFRSMNLNNRKGIVDIRSAFENALNKAEIRDFTFHDLRHTCASYLAMDGATQGELMTVLGHKSPQMTKRYAHFSEDHIAKLMNRTSSKLLKFPEKEDSHEQYCRNERIEN